MRNFPEILWLCHTRIEHICACPYTALKFRQSIFIHKKNTVCTCSQRNRRRHRRWRRQRRLQQRHRLQIDTQFSICVLWQCRCARQTMSRRMNWTTHRQTFIRSVDFNTFFFICTHLVSARWLPMPWKNYNFALRIAQQMKKKWFFRVRSAALFLSLSHNRFFVWRSFRSRNSHTVIGTHDGSSFALFRFHVNRRCCVRMLARALSENWWFIITSNMITDAPAETVIPRDERRRWLIHGAATQIFVRISHRLNCVQGGLEARREIVNSSTVCARKQKKRKNFKFRRWLRFRRHSKWIFLETVLGSRRFLHAF